MRAILFCQNNYAYAILGPIQEQLKLKRDAFIWYVPKEKIAAFPYTSEPYTSEIADLVEFNSDAIFVPGNEVPHYLRGLKVQVFHGLAGEKKGHFRIRHYFDLYLTQGPYFTGRFNQMRAKHGNFDVVETGWPKLDIYAHSTAAVQKEKEGLLRSKGIKKMLLYAPTFSPKLTSVATVFEVFKTLAANDDYFIYVKFHPLMDEHWVAQYNRLIDTLPNAELVRDPSILKYLLLADLLISDTSSVIYEFLLLDKPVISIKSISEHICWDDQPNADHIVQHVALNLDEDPYASQRKVVFEEFHPYRDGRSAERMVEAVRNYIDAHGVPEKRKLSLWRRMKIYRMFGRP